MPETSPTDDSQQEPNLADVALSSDKEKKKLFSHYVNQFLAGGQIDLESIAREHPEYGSEIASQLGRLFEQMPSAESEEVNQNEDVNPDYIGRYRIESQIGEGGFGKVFLAYDDQLERQVAIKVPHRSIIANSAYADIYLAEARALAALDHPRIVPVYDVGRTKDFPCYIVSKYIRGQSLAQSMKSHRLTWSVSAELVASTASAVHHAHKNGLVHRDIKPSNILVDDSGTSQLIDFGIALAESQFGLDATAIGTPAYMSPEQARGEGHRVDGRSDVFSLGVVLYELLVGRRPFQASTPQELCELVTSVDPKPPRQIDEQVPKELERICLKAMAKRASERYSTAHDLADDLHVLLRENEPDSASSSVNVSRATVDESRSSVDTDSSDRPELTPGFDSQSLRIVPKGVRSFDQHDADFFLELMPGPRGRDGLPENIRFWKNAIEGEGHEKPFSVGLIYGPSGCGKSSLVKAGLLPQLSKNTISMYIEANGHETENRMLHHLRNRFPNLPMEFTLREALAAIRSGNQLASDEKMLIVLDQFEQWLHSHEPNENSELVTALRQCDGANLQVIVMVRDDFWMAITRFMKMVDIPLVEGRNSSSVDLFPLKHARNVLAAFGRAYGDLPADQISLDEDQAKFLSQAVAELSENGKVICVRLALFADMMKGHPWTPATLKRIGGSKGIGMAFLESTFSSPSAPPQHRFHQHAARATLNSLVPESGADIKGEMKSQDELLQASGYARRPGDFEALITILDRDLRLITPTDSATELQGSAVDGNTDTAQTGQRYYQLTHDYLVHSLRDWLTSKQKATHRGRAELRLAERASLWNSERENRHLPAWWEYATIRWLTKKSNWTDSQREMMKRAGRVNGLRFAVAAILVVAMALLGRNLHNRAETRRLVDNLRHADTSNVGKILADLNNYRAWAGSQLTREFTQTYDDNAKLHAALALIPNNESAVKHVHERLLNVTPTQFPVVRDLLGSKMDVDLDVAALWEVTKDAQQSSSRRFQAACALAKFDPDHENWNDDDLTRFVTEHLVNVRPSELRPWRDALWSARGHLIDSLTTIYNDETSQQQPRSFATHVLGHYLSSNGERLFDLLIDARPSQFQVINDRLRNYPDLAARLAETQIAEISADDDDEEAKEKLAMRQANAAALLLCLGADQNVWHLLQQKTDDPRLRSLLIHHLPTVRVDPAILARRLPIERNDSIRQGLILALGEYDSISSMPKRDALVTTLLNWYRTDPHPGIHSAIAWTLRRWGEEQLIFRCEEASQDTTAEPANGRIHDGRQWYVNCQGQTFAILRAETFRMGLARTKGGDANETEHVRRIGRVFAIGTAEVTKEQFARFADEHPELKTYNIDLHSKTGDSPQVFVSWFDATAYCNWLSEKEGIPKDEWCYQPNSDGKYHEGMRPTENYLQRTGYRLPSEAEWEFACRAGTTSKRFFGTSDRLLSKYAWHVGNAQDLAWPVFSLKPNDYGLFGILGNAAEWCTEIYRPYPKSNDVVPDKEDMSVLVQSERRVTRGGSIGNYPRFAQPAERNAMQPGNRGSNYGFRVVRTLSTR